MEFLNALLVLGLFFYCLRQSHALEHLAPDAFSPAQMGGSFAPIRTSIHWWENGVFFPNRHHLVVIQSSVG